MRPVEQRNFLCLLADFVTFGTGMSFASQATVLPSFLATLTSSAPLIGLSSTIATGAWLLPQLFAANSLAGRPRRKPFVVVPAIMGRAVFLILGPVVFILAGHPETTLTVFLLLYGLFFVLDGVASIAWLDILARTLSASTRARLIGTGQTVTGAAGIGAGVLVGIILSSNGAANQADYALIFLLAGILFTMSLLAFLFLKEEPQETMERRLPWPDYFRRLAEILRTDHDFRRALVVSILMSGAGLATPFYVIHGLTSLKFPEISVGLFTSAQVAGGIGSGLLLGWVGETRGTRSVVRLWGVLALCTPLLALVLPALGRGVPVDVVMYTYGLVFVLVGAQGNSVMAGFINYVLEFAPPSRRAMYIGSANTVGSVSVLAPLIGGWMLSAGASWPLLFVCAALIPVAGLFLSLRLVEPRSRS
ncbi:MAG TPA: MFS transporter [Spirochaetia bacterium]|nr:MFS transporter [Spirochaetia bacterium]